MGDQKTLYRELYYMMFNRITDAIRALEEEKPIQAHEILCQAQQDAEERYIASGESPEGADRCPLNTPGGGAAVTGRRDRQQEKR